MSINKDLNILDIKNWEASDETILALSSKKQENKKGKDRKILNTDTIKLYCLLNRFISEKPNGFLTFSEEFINPSPLMPVDRLVWWDFELKCGEYSIQIIRHPNLIEVFKTKDLPFEVEEFFEYNFKKYAKEIHETLNTYTKYKLYENHYQSYKKFIVHLYDEMNKIDIEIKKLDPKGIDIVGSNHEKVKNNFDLVSKYMQDTLKYHYMAKSFVLNLAFMLESYINTIIRIIYTQDKDVEIKEVLNYQFKDRIKFLLPKLDFENKIVQDVLKLINLRHKQVHSDTNHVSSEIGYAYYDNDFPVFEINEEHFFIELAKKAHLIFSKEDLDSKYDLTKKFINLVEDSFPKDFLEALNILLNQDILALNTQRNSYGVIFPETLTCMYASLKD